MGGSYGAFLNYIFFYKQGAPSGAYFTKAKNDGGSIGAVLYRSLIEASSSNTSRTRF